MSIVEYVWLGGYNSELRSKTRVLSDRITHIDSVPIWNYDGSSTNQADGEDSEVVLKPVFMVCDPLRRHVMEGDYRNYIVLCDTYKGDGTTVLSNNSRPWALSIFEQKKEELPWFGVEQEYFLMNMDTNQPLGFTKDGEMIGGPQGRYYCSVGAGNAIGRRIAEEHLEACIYAGLQISGLNAEVAPGQWEYQIGPCVGIESADSIWLSRYLLQRIAEKYNVAVSFDPKPVDGDVNGSGCHVNFSTKSMREGTDGKDGIDYIHEAIARLEKYHDECIKVYGDGNERRMTGKHETSSLDSFTFGQANRGASIRIGNDTVRNKQGYFEDRRPASSMNPYLVTAKLYECAVLKE